MTDETSRHFDDEVSSISSQFWSRPAERFENEPQKIPPPVVDDGPNPVPKELLLPALPFSVVNGSVKIHTTSRRGLPPIRCLDNVVPRWVKESPWLFKILFLFCFALILTAAALIVFSSFSSSDDSTSVSRTSSDSDFLAELNNRGPPGGSAPVAMTPTLAPTSTIMLQSDGAPGFVPASTLLPTWEPTIYPTPEIDNVRDDSPSNNAFPPTSSPTSDVSVSNAAPPTPRPTPLPTPSQTGAPFSSPTVAPSPRPTPDPTRRPTRRPTRTVSSQSLLTNEEEPSRPSLSPSVSPTEEEDSKKKKKDKDKKPKDKKPKDDSSDGIRQRRYREIRY